MSEKKITETTAERSGEGSSKIVALNLDHDSHIGAGAVGSVSRYKLDRGNNKNPMYFAIKKTADPSSNSNMAIHSMAVQERITSVEKGWKYTVPTLRHTKEGILMTDLSEGGQNIVFSSNDSYESIRKRTAEAQQQNTEILNNLLKKVGSFFDEEWKNEFNNKAEELAIVATKAGLQLRGDAIFIVIKPNGEYELKIVDADNVRITNIPNPNEISDPSRLKILSTYNKRTILELMVHLEYFLLSNLD